MMPDGLGRLHSAGYQIIQSCVLLGFSIISNIDTNLDGNGIVTRIERVALKVWKVKSKNRKLIVYVSLDDAYDLSIHKASTGIMQIKPGIMLYDVGEPG